MTGIVFQEGDPLYQEGDRSDQIYLVVEGAVEILKLRSNKIEVVGMAGPGDFVGEIATLVDRERTTSARVATDGTRLKLLGKNQFLRFSSRDQDTAYNLLNRLCERLHASSRRATDDTVVQVMRTIKNHNESLDLVAPFEEAMPDASLTIFPETGFLARQMPSEGIVMTETPFIIGRKPDPDEQKIKKPGQWLSSGKDRRHQEERRESTDLSQVHLQLTDTHPYRLSRIHLLFQKMDNGHFVTRDLGSTLGTQINDDFLGTDFPRDSCELNIGDNMIMAGGSDTHFKFRAVVEAGNSGSRR